MLEKATILTTIFTIVDNTMKGSAVIQDILKRPGPTPSLSDSEVVTIALYQELIARTIAFVQALRQKHVGDHNQNRCQAYCSQYWYDGQSAPGKASPILGWLGSLKRNSHIAYMPFRKMHGPILINVLDPVKLVCR